MKKKWMRKAKHSEHVNERRQRADHPYHPRHLDSGPGSNEEGKTTDDFPSRILDLIFFYLGDKPCIHYPR